MPVEIEQQEGIKNAYQHGPISKQVLKLKPFIPIGDFTCWRKKVKTASS